MGKFGFESRHATMTSYSNNLKQFKTNIGQSNHFLITILVGLDGIQYANVTKRNEFSTSWNPKNVNISVQRSRVFAKEAALTYSVSSLDGYFHDINCDPKLINADLSSMFDTSKSIFKKNEEVYKIYINSSIQRVNLKLEYLIVKLAISWRNNITHYNSTTRLTNEENNYIKQYCLTDKNAVKCGLDASRMIENFNSGGCPSFKEVTFLIAKIIQYVTDLDGFFLENVDSAVFVKQFFTQEFKSERLKFHNIFNSAPKSKVRQRKVTTIIDRLPIAVSDTIRNFYIEIDFASAVKFFSMQK